MSDLWTGPALQDGENKLVLLIRNPECLFAYWKISRELSLMLVEYLQLAWSDIRLLIQILSSDEHDSQNFIVQSEQVVDKTKGASYLSINTGSNFKLLLGVKDQQNQFIPILESNYVSLRTAAETVTKYQDVTTEQRDAYWYPINITSTFKQS